MDTRYAETGSLAHAVLLMVYVFPAVRMPPLDLWHLRLIEKFCGDTLSHCGYGCQSGPCLSEGDLPLLHSLEAKPLRSRGQFKVVGQSGVPAMAAGLMPNGRVVFLDKVENYTQIILNNGQYAYSAEYNPQTNEVVGLPYKVRNLQWLSDPTTNFSRPMPFAREVRSLPMEE